MNPKDTGTTESQEDLAYSSSLEASPVATPATVVNTSTPSKPGRATSLLHYNQTLFILTGLAVAAIAVIGMSTLFLSGFQNSSQISQPLNQLNNFSVSNIPLSGLKSSQPNNVTSANNLTVNGQLDVTSTIVLTPMSQPTNPVAGQLYASKTDNQLYYYNGKGFDSIVTGSQLAQAKSSPDVSSFQGQTGDVILSAGNGLSVTGLTISNTGVTSVSGTANQINVSQGNGDVTFSLPQNISTASIPSFSGINLTNALSVPNGGTGSNSLSVGGVLIGNGTAPLATALPGLTGSCLVSNGPGTAPSFQTCPSIIGNGNVSQGTSDTPGHLTMWDSFTHQITDSLLSQSGSTISGTANFNVTGSVAATSFSGDGSGLTNVNATTLNSQPAGFYLNASNINSGTLALINGGTGATTALGARTNLGAAASGANSDITSLSGLTTALSVAQGGTGNISLTTNELLIGNGAGAISVITNGSVGQCLRANLSGAPSFQSCTGGGGGGGVSTLDTLSGDVTINNSSGTGSTITIDDATTLAKGIASFNSSDFSVGSGAVSLANVSIAKGGTGATTALGARTNLGAAASGANSDITSLSALTSITPSSALAIGSSGQMLTIQGNGSTSIVVSNAGFSTTLSFVSPNSNQVVTFPNATGTVCLDSGNCLGGSNGSANAQLSNLNNVAINTSLLPGAFGTIDLGSTTKPFRNLYVSNTGATNYYLITGSATTGNKTLNLPNFTGASADVCLSTGNCAGSGGGVTSSGATANTIALFSGAQVITNSILSQDAGATTVTIAGKLSVSGASGAGITCGATPTVCLNGGDILSGTVPDARLSSNVTLQGNLFNGANQLVKTDSNGAVTIGGSGYNVALADLFVGMNAGTGRSINAAGTINASGADYAEWIPWSGAKPLPGSIVSYNGTNFVVSSGHVAGFIGNDVLDESSSLLVTFTGQVPVLVTGSVSAGDMLVPNGDGTAKAVAPANATINDFVDKIGYATNSASGSGVNTITAIVGSQGNSNYANLQTSNQFADLNVSGKLTTSSLVVNGPALVMSDLTVNGHFITGGATPSATTTASDGSGAAVSITGNDTSGTITITTGSNPTAGGLANIAFSKSFGTQPHINLTPGAASASQLQYFYQATTGNWVLASNNAPQANTTYTFSYFVSQ